MSDIKAFVKSKNTITVQLMKSFYGGKSEFFRLRDDYGLSVILPIMRQRFQEMCSVIILRLTRKIRFSPAVQTGLMP